MTATRPFARCRRAHGEGIGPRPRPVAPRRSEHAELPHSAPASGSIVEAAPRIGVKDTGRRDPVVRQALHSLPRHAAPLTPASKRMEPVAGDLNAEAAHATPVRGDRVIREVTANDCADPLTLHGHGKMTSFPQLLTDLLQLCSHSRLRGVPVQQELSGLGLPADVREPRSSKTSGRPSPRSRRCSSA